MAMTTTTIPVQPPSNNNTIKVPIANLKKKHPNELCQRNRNNNTNTQQYTALIVSSIESLVLSI
eukprot:7829481-Ditylum_brightwellii.AAC.1